MSGVASPFLGAGAGGSLQGPVFRKTKGPVGRETAPLRAAAPVARTGLASGLWPSVPCNLTGLVLWPEGRNQKR